MQVIIKTTTENYLASQTTENNLAEVNALKVSYLTRWHKLVQLQTNQQNMINSDTLNEAYVQGF
ncbi:hypothetical protein JOC59_000547 [Weissella beninensis]|uniref:Uncharacterized protein n=1 Tax=Periweissella beninensis TaxID=504936 RepID=A0ABT0VG19_9LACO|nr:hypothetical protein [Periweissella beninensis]MBM7543843.1 hypothetical protein [Periweissella beninensis]MCM2436776.1 hypothetical protein [Periweissella beninensis]